MLKRRKSISAKMLDFSYSGKLEKLKVYGKFFSNENWSADGRRGCART